MSKIALVVNCTSTSTMGPAPGLDGAQLPRKMTLNETVDMWTKAVAEQIKEGKYISTPGQLYRGKALHTTMMVKDAVEKQEIEVDIFIASLGFGLVTIDREIVSYNINTWAGDEAASLYNIVTNEPFKPARWWEAINIANNETSSPITKMVESGEYEMVLVSMTNKFLELVINDISSIRPDDSELIRIVGPKVGNYYQLGIQAIMRKRITLPYARSTEGLPSGNRNDHPQRCALHFCQTILPKLPIGTKFSEHFEAVKALEGVSERKTANVVPTDQLSDFIKEQKKKKVTKEDAYKEAVEKFGALSEINFLASWTSIKKDVLKDTAAEEAFNLMSGSLKETGSINMVDGPLVIETLKRFVHVAKEFNPSVQFTSKNMLSWVESYFAARKEEVPKSLISANKISRTLRKIGLNIGIAPVIKTGSYGVATYCIQQDE